jgi:hypothetical protein
MSTEDEKPKANKPVHKFRSGAIEVAIWRHEGEKGTFYNATMSRTYKKNDQWAQSDSFGQDDLLIVAELSRQAWAWIVSQPTRQQQAA